MLASRVSASAASLRVVVATQRHGQPVRVWRHWQALAHRSLPRPQALDQQLQVDEEHCRGLPGRDVEGEVLAEEQEERAVLVLALPQAVAARRRRG